MPSSSIIIVTGMSGAGRSSCLKMLEDVGHEAVDNLPVSLLTRLLAASDAPEAPLAIGMDSRTRGLEPASLVRLLAEHRRRGGTPARLLFLECDDETLRRRFTETRRRHPMAAGRPVSEGIHQEREFMAPLKAAADLLYDTSLTSPTDLRRWVKGQFGQDRSWVTVSLVSFAFRNGLPREADLVFDTRFLRNPHYDETLRPKTGLDPEVQDHIRADPDLVPVLDRIEALLLALLPRYRAEGKSYLTIAIGCTGGKHRSVFVTTELARRLRERGWESETIHRDLPRAPAGVEQRSS
jgi:UPF0042 nucleotide-binding protein